MNEKRIEIVESETEGVVLVRVRGVPEKPNDAQVPHRLPLHQRMARRGRLLAPHDDADQSQGLAP